MLNGLFDRKPIIGMVHLLPLPGSPGYGGSVPDIEQAAFDDMRALIRGGADAFILENFGDTPLSTEIIPQAFAVMAAIGALLAKESSIPFGVNVQYNAAEYEWALAGAINADFLRAEAFVENRVGVHGLTHACAPGLMRLRARFPAKTLIFADINTKHTYPLVDQPLSFSICEASASGADALIVTGLLTGQNPSPDDVLAFKRLAGDIPVILGSGISAENAKEYFSAADGAIVGSSIKINGDVKNRIDENRVRELCEAARRG